MSSFMLRDCVDFGGNVDAACLYLLELRGAREVS